MSGRRILHLGSGTKKLEVGAEDSVVNVDLRADVKPDVVWDLDRVPWPFEDATFDAIEANDVVEHLADIVRFMEEAHRVSRSGARINITTPHFSSSNSFTDPTHRQHLGVFSFDYFTGDHELGFYTRVRFAKRRAEVYFHPSLVNTLVWRFARRWPAFWERRLAWMFPAWFLAFELEVVK